MCYTDDARPPLPPVGGAAANHGEMRLTAAGGTSLLAYFARAENPSAAGIVILPDVRGLHQFYRDLAVRFAEAGVDAVAIDYFGRILDHDDRGEDLDWKSLIPSVTQEGVAADTAAAIDHLRSPDGGAVDRVFTVGFCFGGSNSWNQSAMQPGLSGAIGFYGQPARSQDLISRMRAPLLLLVAGQDFTPAEAFQDFSRRLTDAGVSNQMHVYPDAPHSFFDRSFEQHREACDDAWRRILTMVGAPLEG